MRRMRNYNLEIRIAGSPCRPQLSIQDLSIKLFLNPGTRNCYSVGPSFDFAMPKWPNRACIRYKEITAFSNACYRGERQPQADHGKDNKRFPFLISNNRADWEQFISNFGTVKKEMKYYIEIAHSSNKHISHGQVYYQVRVTNAKITVLYKKNN